MSAVENIRRCAQLRVDYRVGHILALSMPERWQLAVPRLCRASEETLSGVSDFRPPVGLQTVMSLDFWGAASHPLSRAWTGRRSAPYMTEM